MSVELCVIGTRRDGEQWHEDVEIGASIAYDPERWWKWLWTELADEGTILLSLCWKSQQAPPPHYEGRNFAPWY
jgi:hypothetical protein